MPTVTLRSSCVKFGSNLNSLNEIRCVPCDTFLYADHYCRVCTGGFVVPLIRVFVVVLVVAVVAAIIVVAFIFVM